MYNDKQVSINSESFLIEVDLDVDKLIEVIPHH
jgi:hypothetical protein